MQFAELAKYFTELEKTSSRLAMTELLVEVLKALPADEVRQGCYLLLGGLGPAYDRTDFQLADKMVVKGIAQATGQTISEVWNEYKKIGDLGTVAGKLQVTSDKLQDVSIKEVYDRLMIVAQENGKGSQERKIDGLALLINGLEPLSVKYVIRIVLGRLRLGFSDKTLLDALSVLTSGGKTARTAIESVYQIHPDIGEIAYLIKKGGRGELAHQLTITLGVPVMPALCQRLNSAQEMVEKMGEVLVEPKFDGTRVQIHISKFQNEWGVKTYTRNLEETTWMFPELLNALEQIQAQEVILDSEAVGMDPKTGKMLPFQETITRKRKHEVEAAIGRVPLRFNVFDVLYVDGNSFIDKPLWQRKAKLAEIVKPGKVIRLVEVIKTRDANELRKFHRAKLDEGYEGVVVKKVDGTYEPGRKAFNWVKFKEIENTSGKLNDTIDAVVMGFYRGKGKRTGFGLGAFLVGLRNQADQLVTLAKIGTGLTDEQWREMKRRLDNEVCLKPPNSYVVDKSLIPDVWVEPAVVVEIAADEITKSPSHSAGYALRFPRLVRFRADKKITEITTVAELLTIKQG